MSGPPRDNPVGEGSTELTAGSYLSRYRIRRPLQALPGELPTPIFLAMQRNSSEPHFLIRAQERPVSAASSGLIDPNSLLGAATAISELDHDAFPPLYDYGALGNDQAFLTWEHEQGTNLRSRFERGPLDLTEAILVGRQIAEALSALHNIGRCHGHLRPASSFLTALGGVRLPAAGLMTEPSRGDSESDKGDLNHRDSAGWAAAAYLAPERLPEGYLSVALDDLTGTSDQRADLWALCVLLYEACTGSLPFHGQSFETMAQAIATTAAEPASPIPGVFPDALEALFKTAFNRYPAHRHQTANQLTEDLRSLEQELQASPRATAQRIQRPVQAEPRPGMPLRRAPAPSSKADEPQFKGLLDQLSERRKHLESGPRASSWSLILPPLALLLLILLTFALLMRTA